MTGVWTVCVNDKVGGLKLTLSSMGDISLPYLHHGWLVGRFLQP